MWEIMNMAINLTLARTILTSLTVLFVLFVLWQFGGPAISDFGLALFIGCIAGIYSTVAIATPIVYLWQKMQGRLDPAENRANRTKTPEKATPEAV